MSKYDYACIDCEVVVEVEHGMKEEPTIKCSECDKPMVRQMSAVPIHFKGPGFFCNDYSKDKQIRSDAAKLQGDK